MRNLEIIATVWFAGWLFTWPALLAYLQRVTPDVALQEYKDDLRVSMVLAVVPFAWIAAVVVLIRYGHGWRVFPRREGLPSKARS